MADRIWWQEGKWQHRSVDEDRINQFFYYIGKGITEKMSAEAAGISIGWVNTRKREDADFAELLKTQRAKAIADKFVKLYDLGDDNVDALKFFLQKNPAAAGQLIGMR